MQKPMIFLCIVCLITIIFSGCIDKNDTSIHESFITTEQLQGCWMFEEESWDESNNNKTYDCSKNANHGSIYNAQQSKSIIIGNTCASFNGTNQYIKIPANNLTFNTITIEAWVKSSNPGPEFSYILSKGSQNCDVSSYAFYTDVNNGICFYVSNGIQTLKSPNPGPTIWDNTWHHIAGTYNGSVVRLFIDGIEIENGTNGNISINYDLSETDLIIGNYIGTCHLPYNGSIDNVFIWDTALTADDIFQHYLYGSIDDTRQQTEPKPVSFSYAQSYLRSFLAPYSINDIIIIKGSSLSIQDNLLLTTIASQMENTKDIKRYTDDSINDSQLTDYSLLVLLGSEKTNSYTQKIIDSNQFQQTSLFTSTPLILQFGTNVLTNQDLLIVYTISEKEKKENHAAEKSPLAHFIDKKYIPAIATSTTILILYLWSIIGNTISEFIFDFISEHVAERKIKKIRKYSNKKILSKKRKITHESIALLLAIIVFSIAMSWTWSEDNTEFQSLIIVNILIVGIVFITREGMRYYLSQKYTIDTSHIFWPLGSFLTLGSTLLGNTFSLASFTMLEDEKDQQMFGKMYYFIFKVLYLICILCFIINFIYPTIYLQMIYVFIIMSLVIDMTPVEPMDGLDVKKWNKKRWMMFYIIVIFSYLIMNFSITTYL